MCERWLIERVKAEEICKEIIEDIVKEGYKFQVSHRELAKAIMRKRGIDERTVQRWINALETFDYITSESTSVHKVYKLNPTKVPNLFKVLNGKPQTKIQ